MTTWIETFYRGIATITSTTPVLAVLTEPGWQVIGSFSPDADGDANLSAIGSVSSSLLVMTARLYCVEPGSVGEVTGSRATIASTVDTRASSARFTLSGGRLYQVQAQVVGSVGDDYFGILRAAMPAFVVLSAGAPRFELAPATRQWGAR